MMTERTGIAGVVLGLCIFTAVMYPAHAPGGEQPDLYAFERRSEVFEFTEKPSVTRDGDDVTITFEVKDFCDVTVAIEDTDGEILRHLASGVLGANAPEPFARDSRRQTLHWDGKDDLGAYVDDKDRVVVRVSLGLTPRFERTLFWSPRKRVRSPRYLDTNLKFAAGPDGVYVYDGGNCEHIRLFDAEGEYVRTVYPPPSDKIETFDGLEWKEFPQDGRRLPLKQHGRISRERFFRGDNRRAVSAMAVHGDLLAAAGRELLLFSPEGGTFQGPSTSIPVHVPARHNWPGGVVHVPPTDIAFSPDGQWIYLAGYMWTRSWRQGLLNGVGRIPVDGEGPMENFAGSLADLTSPDSGGRHGGTVQDDFLEGIKGTLKAGEFQGAVSVAVDAEGRVYVADHRNDRIRVFGPEGGHLDDISVRRPSLVRVNPENGEIYVFSFPLPFSDIENPTMTRLRSLDDPSRLSTVPLPSHSHGRDGPSHRIDIDFSTTPPTIWMGERHLTGWDYGRADRPVRTCAKLLVEEDGKLVVKRDFGGDVLREVVYARGTRHMKQRLYFNPKHRRLYVGELLCPHGEHVTTMADGAMIDPDTGRVRAIRFPFDAEDMAFDLEGHAYLRSFDHIVRYDASNRDPQNWREVPFDYGESLEQAGIWSQSRNRIISAISFYSTRGVASSQMGGFGVSPRGRIIISASNPEERPDRREDGDIYQVMGERYTPPMFPGRVRPWEVHVFDRHGNRVYADAIPGVGRKVGLNMDARDNIYAVVAAVGRVAGEPYYHPFSCSLIKVEPDTQMLSASRAPIPLSPERRPDRPADLTQADPGGEVWLGEGARWIRGGVGFDGKRVGSRGCHCPSQSRPGFDYFARSFLPEIDRYSVLVVDKNNNEIVRIGRYGNIDEGKPLIEDGGPPDPRSIGGDELALMHHQFLAVESDRRLFIGDLGNACIRSVKLLYHAEETVPLKDVPDRAERVD